MIDITMVPVSQSLLVRLLQFSLQNALMTGVNHSIGKQPCIFNKKVIEFKDISYVFMFQYLITTSYVTTIAHP